MGIKRNYYLRQGPFWDSYSAVWLPAGSKLEGAAIEEGFVRMLKKDILYTHSDAQFFPYYTDFNINWSFLCNPDEYVVKARVWIPNSKRCKRFYDI